MEAAVEARIQEMQSQITQLVTELTNQSQRAASRGRKYEPFTLTAKI